MISSPSTGRRVIIVAESLPVTLRCSPGSRPNFRNNCGTGNDVCNGSALSQAAERPLISCSPNDSGSPPGGEPSRRPRRRRRQQRDINGSFGPLGSSSIEQDFVHLHLGDRGDLAVEPRTGHFAAAIARHLNHREASPILVGRLPSPEHVDGARLREILGPALVPVVMPTTVRNGADSYCRNLLWPLLHYVLPDYGAQVAARKLDAWSSYVRLNELFAETVAALYEPGDQIVIFDYHLCLLPAMLRSLLPNGADAPPLVFYLRCPFPTSELFRSLPEAKELLAGILGATLVGFQTHSYARHFISSCTRLLGCETGTGPLCVDYGGVPVSVVIEPLGVPRPRATADFLERLSSFRQLFAGKRLILGIEAADQSRGVVHKLKAFDLFLRLHPAAVGHVLLVQVVYGQTQGGLSSSSSSSMGTETEKTDVRCDARVIELVTQINGTFGTLDYYPVHLYQQPLEADEYFALLCLADVLLMTAERDTVNPILLEYLSLQTGHQGGSGGGGEEMAGFGGDGGGRSSHSIIPTVGHHGLPIFSEFIGLADLLPTPFRVNPWDHRGIAETIHEALQLTPQERAVEYARWIDPFLRRTSLGHSIDTLLGQLSVSQSQLSTLYSPTPQLNLENILATYERVSYDEWEGAPRQRRLLLLDYDGTLAPISKHPSGATPSSELLRLLRLLTSDNRNLVYIISGRDATTLEQWLGSIPRLGLSAEHGCFLRPISETPADDTAGAAPRWLSVVDVAEQEAWKEDVATIMAYYVERTPGSFVEHKSASLTWHYRQSDPEYGSWQAKELLTHLEHTIASVYPVEIISGKKNLEVRPGCCNKGAIVRALLERHGRPRMVLCVGDDRTDEDMFKVLQETFPGEEQEEIGTAMAIEMEMVLATAMEEQEKTDGRSAPDKVDCFTCSIGPASKKTMAKHRLSSPEQIVSLLLRLANLTADRTQGVTL